MLYAKLDLKQYSVSVFTEISCISGTVSFKLPIIQTKNNTANRMGIWYLKILFTIIH